MQQQEKQLFSFGECSTRLGVSRDSLRRLARSGRLRTVRINRRVLVPATEVDRLASEGTGNVRAQNTQKAG